MHISYNHLSYSDSNSDKIDSVVQKISKLNESNKILANGITETNNEILEIQNHLIILNDEIIEKQKQLKHSI